MNEIKLIVGKTYKFTFNIVETILYFNGKVIDVGKDFFTFIDKYGETLTYANKYLVSFKEVVDGKK